MRTAQLQPLLHCCTTLLCCTAVLTIPVVDIFNVFACVCNLKIRTRKLGYGTVCNQEEHWNELTCDLLISCSFASLCPHNKQSRAEQSPQGRMSTMILCFRWDLHCQGEWWEIQRYLDKMSVLVAPAPMRDTRRGSAHRSMVPAPVVVLPSPALAPLTCHNTLHTFVAVTHIKYLIFV